MTVSGSSKVLRVVSFILVPAAYLIVVLSEPADSYSRFGREGISAASAGLMLAVFLVSLLSWRESRVVAVLGFIACLLWLARVLLPVL